MRKATIKSPKLARKSLKAHEVRFAYKIHRKEDKLIAVFRISP